MNNWMILEFMIPARFATVIQFDQELMRRVPPEDQQKASQRKYVYMCTGGAVRMAVPECDGVLAALQALQCPLAFQERITLMPAHEEEER